MHLSLGFTRSIFAALSLFFMTAFVFSCPHGSFYLKLSFGLGLGTLFFLFLLTTDYFLRKCTLRSFNVLLIGLFSGYLMGQVLCAIFSKILQIPFFQLSATTIEATKVCSFLLGTYLGTILAIRSAHEIHLSLPFIRVEEELQKKEEEVVEAVKPSVQAGDAIRIKIQRYGKEPKQGVGYLDDGTMVVINNGGDFLGEIIDSQVISVKQTSAGRIIFTNALTENFAYDS